VVVATEMIVVGDGMIVCWTRWAVTGCFDMQKIDGDIVRSGKSCFFNLMGKRKNGIDGKTDHHRYQGCCNDFFEFLVQASSNGFFSPMRSSELYDIVVVRVKI